MSLFIKICGVTTSPAAVAVSVAGADGVGFVFASSPRQVTPEEAAALSGRVASEIARVAVFRTATQDEVDRVLGAFVPDIVQADAESPIDLPDRVEFLPVYRQGLSSPESSNGPIMFEGAESGAGEQVDLAVATDLAREHQLILAGGLDPDNVGPVVEEVRPYGVDVSSGVEDRPGVKNPDLIAAFVANARFAAQESP